MREQILYECPCGKRYRFNAKHAGRSARCVECKLPYKVPRDEAETTPSFLVDETSELNKPYTNEEFRDIDLSKYITTKTDPEVQSPNEPFLSLLLDSKPSSDSPSESPSQKIPSEHKENRNPVKDNQSSNDDHKTEEKGNDQKQEKEKKAEKEKGRTRKINNYSILGVIERGGMGRVSLARDNVLERLVAIKEIRSAYVKKEMYRKRLVLEAKITGYLDHPGIVPVYALENDDDDNPFYTMRRIQGGVSFEDAINEYHKEKTKEKLRELLRHYIAVCQVIAYAHSEGVIHRDLKPQNLMLGKFGATFVLDWGLAKKMVDRKKNDEMCSILDKIEDTQNITRMDTRVGTKWYKAPEYLATGESHPSNDIYSLGMVLFKILTNKLPYDNSQLSEMRALALENPMRPTDFDPKVPKPLAAICMKAIEKDYRFRYGSTTKLAEDVQRWLENQPVSVHTYTFWERMTHLFQRKKSY